MTDAQDQEYVWILGLEGRDGDTDRARFFRRDEARLGRQRVPADQLGHNIESFVRAMGEAIANIPGVLSGYSIDSIEIAAEISASGKVSLLGSGGEVAGKGGIAFTLTRARTTAGTGEDRAGGQPDQQPP